jgi:orotate phosphoribosyltransferase
MDEHKPIAFMSYEHFANEHDRGYLTDFCKCLSGEVQIRQGEEFPIFQDRKNIEWGEAWDRRIKDSVDSATFLIAIITPGFFKSKYCRNELQRFLEREKTLGRDDLVFPVYYVETPLLKDKSLRAKDELAKIIASRQCVDWRELRSVDLNSKQARKAIEKMAIKIRKVLSGLNNISNITNGSIIDIKSLETNRITTKSAAIEEASREDKIKLSKDYLLDLLNIDGCILKGHFRLVSTRHSDSYINARIGFMNPLTCEVFAKAMIDMFKLLDIEPNMLASNTIGGILLASRVKDMLDIPLLVGRQDEDNVMVWIDPEKYDEKSLSNVVLIDDILTTGVSLGATYLSLKDLGAKAVNIVVAIDRRAKPKDLLRVHRASRKVLSVVQFPLNDWDESDCEICPRLFTDLQNPEQKVAQVLLSMPLKKSLLIINEYEKIYRLQRAEEQLKEIYRLKPWFQSLFVVLSE